MKAWTPERGLLPQERRRLDPTTYRQRQARDAFVESQAAGKFTPEYQRQLAQEVRSARLICERRKARREVLHATGHAGTRKRYANRKPPEKTKC